MAASNRAPAARYCTGLRRRPTTNAREEWTRFATAPSGVELLHAHYTRHVYDRHAHESYAIGVTEAGVQTFTCRGVRQASSAGRQAGSRRASRTNGPKPTPGRSAANASFVG